MVTRDAAWAVQQYEAVRELLPEATMPGRFTRAANLGEIADVFDDLLAGALGCLSHLVLLGGYDEPETLPYQIALFAPISADVRQPPLHA